MTYYRLLIALVSSTFLAGTVLAQSPAAQHVVPVDAAAAQPTALIHAVFPLSQVPTTVTPALDLAVIQQEDEAAALQGDPPRFAIPNTVNLTPEGAGFWERVDEQTLLWRQRIQCPGALSINLGFTDYFMPRGAMLFVYAADQSYRIGPLTEADNNDARQFWTPVVLAEDIIVELTVPEAAFGEVALTLTSINHGYRFFGEKDDSGPRSGSCNIDVICPQGDGWRNEIPASGVYTVNGTWTCSGSMINNTSQNQTPYFLTAYHCGVTSSNASGVVVYWNFQSPTCGQQGGGSLSQYQSGSTFRARYSNSDFCLLQLNSSPNPAWGITFAGWDRGTGNPTSAVAIHHPSTDEKSISFENDPCTTASYLGTSSPGDSTHIRVIDWDLGTTEPGSSGSPLFNQNHRIVGQLHGGYAACGNDSSDWYGRLSVSWTGGGTSATRLSDWLDPGNTGATSVDTLNPSAAGLAVTPSDGLSSSGAAGGPFTPSSKAYTLTNQGATSINYTVSKTANWVTLSGTGGTLAGGASTTVTVSINSNANSLAVGSYNDTVTFTNTTDHVGDTTRSVALSVLPALTVTPTDGLTSTGMIGGAFSPGSKVFTLQNQSSSGINYTASNTANWVTLSSTGGTLAGGASTTITVSINSNANSLPVGSYSDTVTFTNTTNHSGDTTRSVSLTVNPLSNDLCANAFVVCPGTYAGTTVGMTLDGGVSVSCDGSSPGVDVWYQYTPGTSGSATLSLCTSGTVWDSVLSVHTGSCPGTTQVGCNDDGCSGSGGRHGTLTVSVTGGTTYLIRIGGYSSSYSGPFTLTISGPACGSADTTPPTPNPMTFATAPAPTGTSAIAMTATTATDAGSPPVSYYFNFVSGGSGGNDSAWQSGATYTDTGLTANTGYTYRVKARDSAATPNETTYSANAATATWIETPTGVSFGGVTANSIVLNAGGALSNLTTGASGVYFDSTTAGGDGGINAWVSSTVDTAAGLSPNTTYTFRVKARNQNSLETAYSPTASKTTLANVPAAPILANPTTSTLTVDVSPNGNPAATEFAILCTAASPTDAAWAGKYVSAAGNPSAAAVWRTDATWATATVQGLQACTTYTFAVKARNAEGVETSFGLSALLGTAGTTGDINNDGVIDGLDIAGFVRAKLGEAPWPDELPGCADFGTGTLDGDLASFIDALLN